MVPAQLTNKYMITFAVRSGRKIGNHFIPAPLHDTCGGLLCDEMGLGKTLQCLMLVATNPPPPGWAIKEGSLPRQIRGASGKNEPCAIRTTLIIAPSNLLGQWGEEVIKHFEVRGHGMNLWGDLCSYHASS